MESEVDRCGPFAGFGGKNKLEIYAHAGTKRLDLEEPGNDGLP